MMLLAEKDLTYDKALEISISQEAAAQNAQTLRGMWSCGLLIVPVGSAMESINVVKSGKLPARQSSTNE